MPHLSPILLSECRFIEGNAYINVECLDDCGMLVQSQGQRQSQKRKTQAKSKAKAIGGGGGKPPYSLSLALI